jgi:HSP20 family protein
MAKDEVTMIPPAVEHGWLDWMPGRGVLHAVEHAFEDMPMRIEELRVDGEFVLRAEIAGVDPERDVQVKVNGGVLRIRAERREPPIGTEDSRRSEFHYGYFSRVIALPDGAARDQVKATYHDGILEVRVPLEETRTENITVPVSRA